MGPGGKGRWGRSFMNMEEDDLVSWRWLSRLPAAVPSYRQMSLTEIHLAAGINPELVVLGS